MRNVSTSGQCGEIQFKGDFIMCIVGIPSLLGFFGKVVD